MSVIFKRFLRNYKCITPNYRYAMFPWIFMMKQGKSNISDSLIMKTTLPVNSNVTPMQKLSVNQNYPYVPSRSSYLNAGRPEIRVNAVDIKNTEKLITPRDMNSDIKNHGVIYREFCANPDCASKNCNTIDAKNCKLDSSGPVVREVVGNYTSKLPEYKMGIRVKAPNYSGQDKDQCIVLESQGIIIDKNINFIKYENATEYLQNPKIYEIIKKSVKSSYYLEKHSTEKTMAADYIPSTSSTNTIAADFDPNSPKIYIDADDNV